MPLTPPKLLIYQVNAENKNDLVEIENILLGNITSGGRSEPVGYVFSTSSKPSVSNVILNFDGCYYNIDGEFILDPNLVLLVGTEKEFYQHVVLHQEDTYVIGGPIFPNIKTDPIFLAVENEVEYTEPGPRIVRIGFSYEVP